MIFYGWRKNTLFVNDMPMHACTGCNTPGMLQLFVNYTSVHLYWIFGVVTNRKYIVQCSACRNGTVVKKHDVAAIITNDPVPFMHRWGLAVFAGLAVVAIAIFSNTR
jgi:hypothetical protein